MRIIAAVLTLLAALQTPAPPPPPTRGFRAEFLRDLSDVEKKIEDLAAAMPADKYSWRPAPGVRSISEVYVHIAGANYLFASFVGVKPPAGISRDMEKTVTEKAKVLEVMKQSFDHARQTVQGLSDEDMSKPVKMFGRDTTYGGVLFTMANHMHEHLGQSIAYARNNGVVPPWSM